MKYLNDLNVKDKKVILRLDLNVTIKEGKILDDTKIKKSVPTIKYLLENNAHILIMSHLGKVKTEEDKLSNSLEVVSKRLSELLDMPVSFIRETRGTLLEESFNNNQITVMENTRFEDVPNKLESSCNDELAKYWASLGEAFINDAFGTSHRCHASNYGIAKYLPSAYGYLINEEITGLAPIISDIKKPFTVVMGGAKVDDKVALIKSLLKECDYLLVGGGIANTFLSALKKEIGSSLYSEEYVKEVAGLISLYKEKVITPIDVVIDNNGIVQTVDVDNVPSNGIIYDIGSKTVEEYKKYISMSETIFLNGTMGMYENDLYKNGTNELFKCLAASSAELIAGGGDALASVNKLGYANDFDFLSTGGGATLEYIANKELSCFKGL